MNKSQTASTKQKPGLIVGTLSTKASLLSKVSVTRLGKFLPSGQKFLALGDFIQGKIGQNLSWIKLVGGLFGPFLWSLGDFFTKTSGHPDFRGKTDLV
jgi:hypothetical protein